MGLTRFSELGRGRNLKSEILDRHGLLGGGTLDPTEPDGGADAATRTLERKGCACRFLPAGGEGRSAAAMLPYTVNFKVSARTLTGVLNAHNKAAVDW